MKALVAVLFVIVLGGCAAPSAANHRESLAVDAQVRSAFDSFAQNWMENLRGSALHTGSTVKRFSTTHTEEVKPTGSVSNPYVGILHYTEESYNCSDAAHKNCTLVESTPVTEIFRYQNGKWLY
jgi:hypothetical protein